jgi:nitroreductase
MTRNFDPRPIPEAELTELLDLARRAPSAGFSQGVHFLLLTGEALTRFWVTSGGAEWYAAGPHRMLDAPALVVPIADPTAYTRRYAEADKIEHGLDQADQWVVPFWITDAAMAVQNLLLLAEERGLGALYFGFGGTVEAALAEVGVPAHVLQVGGVLLGYRAADDVPSGSAVTRPRRALDEVVHRNGW